MKPIFLLLILLALSASPTEARGKHRPKPPGENYTWIRGAWHKHPPLVEMKRRFQWVQTRNKAEHFPRWKYEKKGNPLTRPPR